MKNNNTPIQIKQRLIIGKPGSGKTSFLVARIAPFFFEAGAEIYGNVKIEKGGKIITTPVSYYEIENQMKYNPNKGVLFMDEGAINFNSRSSWDEQNKILSKFGVLARKYNKDVRYAVQHEKMIDVNARRLADAVYHCKQFRRDGKLLFRIQVRHYFGSGDNDYNVKVTRIIDIIGLMKRLGYKYDTLDHGEM